MNATAIVSETLIGMIGDGNPTEPGGANCCSLACEGGEFNIVNFKSENLRKLLKLGLTWPVACKEIGPGVAIIHDPRIGERWYEERYCEVCCPRSLLPLLQRQAHERAIVRGERQESDTCVWHHSDKKAEFP